MDIKKIIEQLEHGKCELEYESELVDAIDDAITAVKKLYAKNEQLRKLCYASLHLLKGSDLIYDPRGDTGPTHWLQTRDRLIAELERVV